MDYNTKMLLDYMKTENVNPDEIKSQVIEMFKKYFKNYDNLVKYSMDFLVPDWINYSKLKSQNVAIECIDRIISILNQNNQNSIIKTTLWSNEIFKAADNYWSVKNLEIAKKDLDLYDFAAECFKNIGQIIEGLSKPFLKWYFHIFSDVCGKNYSYDEIYNRDLGVVIDYFSTKNELDDIFIIKPFNVKLNQWRNIAYHHKYEINNDKIICKYKKQDIEEIVELSKEELFDLTLNTFAIYILLKTAHSLYFFDNRDEIRNGIVQSTDVKIRKQTIDFYFYSTIIGQGFEILNIELSEKSARMILNDSVSNDFDIKRAIHS